LDLWSKAKQHFRESSGHEKMIKIEVVCWRLEGTRVFEWKDNIQRDFNETYFGSELKDIKIKPNSGVS
jgi:hypothetical protein